jgi:hypothetical protein
MIKPRSIRRVGHVACRNMGERSGAYRYWWGKPQRKRLLGRPRRRWKDKIIMDLQEVDE